MYTNTIYEERISSLVMIAVIGIVGAIAVMFLVFYIVQTTVGWITEAPNWYWLMMFLIFTIIGAFVSNFRTLTITITSSDITVRYGMLKSVISWDNVEKCSYDKDSSLGYSGFGLRIARGHGTWIRAYNLMNRPRIALDLKTGWSRRIVFSTENPEKIMETAKELDVSTY